MRRLYTGAAPAGEDAVCDHYGHGFAGLITTGMFALFASRAARLEGPSPKRSKASRTESDVTALLARMRQRHYPETVPVLASFWLKTVYASSYTWREWNELNHLLMPAAWGGLLGGSLLDQASREALGEIQNWIEETIVRKGHTPEYPAPHLEPVRPALSPERLIPFVVRLLNEWVPVEVAHMPIKESESEVHSGGIPILVFGSALECVLAREHLSRETLEMLVEPGGICSQYVYPADVEILRDVALSLLGRTRAPTPTVLPAAPLCLTPQSSLGADYSDAVRNAFLVGRAGNQELRVPLAPERVRQIMEHEQLRIGSVIVTMDGRWWEPENIQSAEQYCVVYRPGGRLRIDYSGDYARLRVPWPEKLLRWPGIRDRNDCFKTFGREWRVTKYEMDGEHTWLHLEILRVLPISELIPGVERSPWKLRPASVDMAWTALGSALARSLVQKSNEPIEELRHADLIPLGRAIMRFAQCLTSWQPQTSDAMEQHLTALRYLESPVLSEYGRVPWRILPGRARARLLRLRRYPAIVKLVNEVLEGVPDTLAQSPDRNGSAASL